VHNWVAMYMPLSSKQNEAREVDIPSSFHLQAAHKQRNAIVSHVDVVPTLMSLMGVDCKRSNKVIGHSLVLAKPIPQRTDKTELVNIERFDSKLYASI
jgi:phosphoglycerol transferase MdoB-like AlkP superfamily enzyme